MTNNKNNNDDCNYFLSATSLSVKCLFFFHYVFQFTHFLPLKLLENHFGLLFLLLLLLFVCYYQWLKP